MYSLCGAKDVGQGFKIQRLQCWDDYHFLSAEGEELRLALMEVSIVKAIITTSGEINAYCTRGFKNPINKAK